MEQMAAHMVAHMTGEEDVDDVEDLPPGLHGGVYVAHDDQTPLQIAKELGIDIAPFIKYNKDIKGLRHRSKLIELTRLKIPPPSSDKDNQKSKKRSMIQDSTNTPPQKRGNPNTTTGLIGVSESGNNYKAQLSFDGTTHYLGTFNTKEEAGIAYDRFVVDKSNEEVTYALNFPNTTDEQRHPTTTKTTKNDPINSKKRKRTRKTCVVPVNAHDPDARINLRF